MLYYFIKYRSWIITHFAALIMLCVVIIDHSKWKIILVYSGYVSVVFLAITLALNPIKILRPKWIFITELTRIRRELGVASFSYAAVHVICYCIKKGSLQKIMPYLLHPALFSGIWIGFPILLVLAITSNQFFMKKLTFPTWKRLHDKIYIAQFAIIVHMLLTGTVLWTIVLFSPVYWLQYQRNKAKRS